MADVAIIVDVSSKWTDTSLPWEQLDEDGEELAAGSGQIGKSATSLINRFKGPVLVHSSDLACNISYQLVTLGSNEIRTNNTLHI